MWFELTTDKHPPTTSQTRLPTASRSLSYIRYEHLSTFNLLTLLFLTTSYKLIRELRFNLIFDALVVIYFINMSNNVLTDARK